MKFRLTASASQVCTVFMKNAKNKVYKYFNFRGEQEKVYCWKSGGELSTIKLAV